MHGARRWVHIHHIMADFLTMAPESCARKAVASSSSRCAYSRVAYPALRRVEPFRHKHAGGAWVDADHTTRLGDAVLLFPHLHRDPSWWAT